MYHLDDDYFSRFNQPSSSTVQFPSESLRYGGQQPNYQQQQQPHQSHGYFDESLNTRTRSHSADARRSAFQHQPRTYSEEHDNYTNTWNGTPLRSTEVNFPSQQRRPASTTPWAYSEHTLNVPSSQSFSEHLRERSPASGSALLDLLSRYPSAQHSISNSPSLQAYLEDKRYNYSSSKPAFEYTVRNEEPNVTRTTAIYQNVIPANGASPQTFHQRIQTTFSSNGPISTSFSNTNNYNYNTYHQDQRQQEPYNPPHETQQIHQTQQQYFNRKPDTDQLELLAARLLDDNMSRSTSEWSKSFGELQNRFQTLQTNNNHHDFATSGSLSLPRRVAKSSSNYEVQNSVLGRAVERRAAEAPEPRRSGALDNFWCQTISSRPSSPTIQRIPTSLTAAERLQLLQEPIETDKRQTQKVGNGQGVAARKAQLMADSTDTIDFNNKPRVPLNPSFPSNSFLLNFNELDNAVSELSNAARNNAFNGDSRRVGGCGRFPTGDHAFSPPPLNQQQQKTLIPVQRKIHSPSPTEDNSDSSSVYQIPTGLPHPKPKHNVKEQLYLAGVHTPNQQMSRSIYRNGPNFPVPTTGSVASRITEFEKRPGTPTIQLASTIKYHERSPTPSANGGNMSPRSAVFRAKPVIHVDLGTANHMGDYQPTPPVRHVQIHSIQIQQAARPVQKQYNSTHSIFDFKSNQLKCCFNTFRRSTADGARCEDDFNLTEVGRTFSFESLATREHLFLHFTFIPFIFASAFVLHKCAVCYHSNMFDVRQRIVLS
ncbi:unnamed protein product [Caenorhabditis bovis]|uniref:Uncharacterized protein n=1 Tax=Caenorhabditis bovis TaxID=2654633 RepID=A0A8S1EC36_9PELO|nr:unnamed protein product [Caenorhabditis bovis]